MVQFEAQNSWAELLAYLSLPLFCYLADINVDTKMITPPLLPRGGAEFEEAVIRALWTWWLAAQEPALIEQASAWQRHMLDLGESYDGINLS